jgi:hypothetical protein
LIDSNTQSCGYEGNAEAERGSGDPAVGVVLALAERVTDLHAVGAEARVGVDELVAGVDDHASRIPQPRSRNEANTAISAANRARDRGERRCSWA